MDKKLILHTNDEFYDYVLHYMCSKEDIAKNIDTFTYVSETNLKPFDLLNIVLKIEKKFGRERKVKNSPRTLDIDIICYDNLILNDENLQIPHPNIQDRLFVLMPICDLNENWKHPIHSKTALEFIKSFSEEQINKLKKA